jgi:hypothetical protein
VRGLEKIFSPVAISKLSDAEAEALASEPASAKRRRKFFEERRDRLVAGREVFRSVV